MNCEELVEKSKDLMNKVNIQLLANVKIVRSENDIVRELCDLMGEWVKQCNDLLFQNAALTVKIKMLEEELANDNG